jgi:hypothetical protein
LHWPDSLCWQHEELNLIRGFFDKEWTAKNALEMSFKEKKGGNAEEDSILALTGGKRKGGRLAQIVPLQE